MEEGKRVLEKNRTVKLFKAKRYCFVMEDKRAKFLKVFANVQEDLRNDILAVVDEKPYTWNTAFIEIKDNTLLGGKILKVLEKMEII